MPHSIRTLFVLPDAQSEETLCHALAQAAPAAESMLRRGYAVDFASAGGDIGGDRLDRLDRSATGAAEQMLEELETRSKITRARRLAEYDPADYSGIVFLGGAEQDWSDIGGVTPFVRAGLDDEHVLGAIGGGVAVLKAATDEQLKGRHIIAPESMSGWIEQRGAVREGGQDGDHIWMDRGLVTAQNDDAAEAFGEALVTASEGERRRGAYESGFGGQPGQAAPLEEPVKPEAGYIGRDKHGLEDNKRGTHHPKEQYEPERYREGRADPTPKV